MVTTIKTTAIAHQNVLLAISRSLAAEIPPSDDEDGGSQVERYKLFDEYNGTKQMKSKENKYKHIINYWNINVNIWNVYLTELKWYWINNVDL